MLKEEKEGLIMSYQIKNIYTGIKIFYKESHGIDSKSIKKFTREHKYS